MAVASAGPYASHLHLAPHRTHHGSTSSLKFFYGPDALPAAQPTALKAKQSTKSLSVTTTTTTILRPVVRDYPGESVPEG